MLAPSRMLTKYWLAENLIVIPLAALVAGSAAYWVMAHDRMPPLSIYNIDIVPERAVAGTKVAALLDIEWKRICRSVVSRELVDAEGQVRRYRPFSPELPVRLGSDRVRSEFWAFKSLPEGNTIYRGVMRFEDCGWTSGFWPLEVQLHETRFEITSPK